MKLHWAPALVAFLALLVPLVAASDDHQRAALNLWLVSIGLTCVVLAVWGLHKLHTEYMSESGAIILLGIVLGGIVALIDYLVEGNEDYIHAIKFDQDTFVHFILPIIIFEAGYSMKHGGVLRSLGAVLMLAIPGTLISTLIIGLSVYGVSSFAAPGLYAAHGSLFICLAFGSLLSATDPVAVIAVLGSKYDMTKEPPLLYNIIFGESVLNDAVAIVLFTVMMRYVDSEVSAGNIFLAIANFIGIFIASGLIGYVYGLLCSVFTRFIDLRAHPHFEIVVAMLFALGSYYVCEFAKLSGIMGLFVTARMIGHHAAYNMSAEAQKAAPFVFKTLASLAESAVFFLLGTAVWAYPHSWNIGFAVLVVCICLISRACVVFPICSIANISRKREKISAPMQFFAWFSGLRGAIAFGLAVILNEDSKSKIDDENGGVLLSTTLVVILFTVLGMGSFVASLLKRLELDKIPPRTDIKDAKTEAANDNLSKNFGRRLKALERKFIHPYVRRPEVVDTPLSPKYNSGFDSNGAADAQPPGGRENNLAEPLTSAAGTQTPDVSTPRERDVSDVHVTIPEN